MKLPHRYIHLVLGVPAYETTPSSKPALLREIMNIWHHWKTSQCEKADIHVYTEGRFLYNLYQNRYITTSSIPFTANAVIKVIMTVTVSVNIRRNGVLVTDCPFYTNRGSLSPFCTETWWYRIPSWQQSFQARSSEGALGQQDPLEIYLTSAIREIKKNAIIYMYSDAQNQHVQN